MDTDPFLNMHGFNHVMETLIENTHSNIVVVRVSEEERFDIVFVNQTFLDTCQKHGIIADAETLVGQTIGKVFAGNLRIRLSDVDRLKLLLSWVHRTNNKLEYIDEFQVRDLGNAVFNTSLIPLDMGEEGRMIFYIANNITDLINRERQLKSSRNELSMILNNIHDAITLFEIQRSEPTRFIVKNINRVAMRMMESLVPGVQEDQILGKEALEAFEQFKVFPIDELKNNLAELQRCFDQKKVIESNQAWYRPNGELNSFMVVKHIPVFNEDGMITNILRVSRDVTEAHLANLALQENEHRLSMAMSVSELGSFDWDPKSNVSKTNEVHDKIFGSGDKDFKNPLEAFIRVLHPEDKDRILEGLSALMTDPQRPGDQMEEFRIIDPNGNIKWIRSHSSVERNEDGEVIRVIGTSCDITPEKEYESQLIRHNRELKSLNRVLEERERILMDAVFHTSHKVRRPLANILALGDLLAGCPNMKDEDRKTIDFLIQSVHQLDQEVRDLDQRLCSFKSLKLEK
ncbi:MAG: PAS domain-containing protein [Bacteroidota bacterium]|nr:PAS domain-containing protein [Bacteroidota bacterium]